jgi:hypothetical protein
VDVIGNQKIAALFNEREFTWYQGRLAFTVFALTLMLGFPMIYGYLAQARNEIEQFKDSIEGENSPATNQ